MPAHCLLINGSSRGSDGNSAAMLQHWQRSCRDFEFQTMHLVEIEDVSQTFERLRWADAFVFATGTYWDSWGWPLQRFLESATETEGTSLWLGKPAAVLVTMHSVGGKSVLSRLQGVLSSLGAVIPPMTGIVISAVGQAALQLDDD